MEGEAMDYVSLDHRYGDVGVLSPGLLRIDGGFIFPAAIVDENC